MNYVTVSPPVLLGARENLNVSPIASVRLRGALECKGVLLIVRRPVIGDPDLRLAGLGGNRKRAISPGIMTTWAMSIRSCSSS
jgi:hypothetical protein